MSNTLVRLVQLIAAIAVLILAVVYRELVWVCLQLFFFVVLIPLLLLFAFGVIGEETLNAVKNAPAMYRKTKSWIKEEVRDGVQSYNEVVGEATEE